MVKKILFLHKKGYTDFEKLQYNALASYCQKNIWNNIFNTFSSLQKKIYNISDKSGLKPSDTWSMEL